MENTFQSTIFGTIHEKIVDKDNPRPLKRKNRGKGGMSTIFGETGRKNVDPSYLEVLPWHQL